MPPPRAAVRPTYTTQAVAERDFAEELQRFHALLMHRNHRKRLAKDLTHSKRVRGVLQQVACRTKRNAARNFPNWQLSFSCVVQPAPLRTVSTAGRQTVAATTATAYLQ